jgi:hypothetical protein
VKRWKLLVVLIGLVILVAVGTLAGWPLEGAITREKYARIRHGMARAEVVALLGPPGDYSTGPLMMDGNFGVGENVPPIPIVSLTDVNSFSGSLYMEWLDDTGNISITLEPDGQVWGKGFTPLTRAKQTRFANLAWRIRRQWHRWFPA